MENESNIIDTINETIEINDNKIFKFDYKNQQLENNLNYIKWKDSNIKEYGSNAKLFKCKKCKIMFCSKYEDIIKEPYYLAPCIICKQYICYFCSYSYIHLQEHRKIFCCYKRILNISFFICAPHYTKEYDIFESFYLCFLIPVLNLFIQCILINKILFVCLATSKSKNEGILVKSNMEKSKFFIIIYIFTYLLLSIPCLLVFNFFVYFLYLLSLPFKSWLFKYYLGIFDTNDQFLI